jgi:hypothetical protein
VERRLGALPPRRHRHGRGWGVGEEVRRRRGRNPSRRARRVNGIGGGDARAARGAGGRRRRRPGPRRRPPPFWVGARGVDAFFFIYFFHCFFVVLFGRRSLVSRVPLGWPTCQTVSLASPRLASRQPQQPKSNKVKPSIAFRFILLVFKIAFTRRLRLVLNCFQSLCVHTIIRRRRAKLYILIWPTYRSVNLFNKIIAVEKSQFIVLIDPLINF